MKGTQLEQNKQAWIMGIKAGNSKALELLYRTYRSDFVHWITQKHNCTQQQALDIFQESVLALYKNAKAGYLDEMKSSVKTYLFAIGQKLFLRQLQRQKVKTAGLEGHEELLEQLRVMPLEEGQLNKRQALISKLLRQLRLVCQDILVMYYYQGMSMKAIAEEQNYRSANVAKVMKARCMESFRKLVLQVSGNKE